MSDSLLDKYVRTPLKVSASAATPANGESNFSNADANIDHAEVEMDPIDVGGCFGYLRGIRERAVMLQLRWIDGRVLAVPYGWIERIEYAPEHGIKLTLAGLSISIQGVRLNHAVAHAPSLSPTFTPSLFDTLTRHRVTWIRESLPAHSLSTRLTDLAVVHTMIIQQ